MNISKLIAGATTALLVGGGLALASALPANATDFEPHSESAGWLIPASWDKTVTPSYQEAIFPQDRLVGSIPCDRWAQLDELWIENAEEQATFDNLGDVLTQGEDSSIYASHEFVYGGDCVIVPEQPADTVVSVSVDTLDCNTRIVTTTTTTTTTGSVLVDNAWVPTEPVVTTSTATRDATVQECPLPEEPTDPTFDTPTISVTYDCLVQDYTATTTGFNGADNQELAFGIGGQIILRESFFPGSPFSLTEALEASGLPAPGPGTTVFDVYWIDEASGTHPTGTTFTVVVPEINNTACETPVVPEEPVEPEEPVTPEEPVEPEEPVTPVTPEEPVAPVVPSEPVVTTVVEATPAETPQALAATGTDSGIPWAVSGAAAVALLVGAGLLVARRRVS